MKKLMLLLSLLLGICSCALAAEGEWIYQEEMELAWGELRWFDDAALEDIVPEGKTVWQSTNENAASVDRWGNVQAAKPETLQQTFIIAERGGVSYSWKVTVRPRSEEILLFADGEVLDKRILNLDAGETQLSVGASVLPEGAPAQVKFSVSGKGASIDENGLLTIAQAGRYTIAASAQDKGRASAKAEILAVHPVASVGLSGPIQMTGGQTVRLEAAIAPEHATVRDLVWTSSDPAVASVDDMGNVTAQKVDAIAPVVITARAADGFGASCDFTLSVVPAAAKVDILLGGESFPVQTLVLDASRIGTVIELESVVYPAQAQQLVKWSSSDNGVVKVDSSGRIGIVGRGTCRIAAKAADGSGAARVLHVAVGKTEGRPYYLEVDKGNQVVRVYEQDESGLYTRLVRRMVCSTGTSDGIVENGLYNVHSTRHKWMSTVVEGVYAKYGTRFYEHIWFHSLPYQGTRSDRMDAEGYALLGTRASHGCIRLLAADAKWIYENVPGGCWMIVCKCERTESEYGAVSWPQAPGRWDPTDDEPDNPDYDPTYTSQVPNA